jgi:hypothetical protein
MNWSQPYLTRVLAIHDDASLFLRLDGSSLRRAREEALLVRFWWRAADDEGPGESLQVEPGDPGSRAAWNEVVEVALPISAGARGWQVRVDVVRGGVAVQRWPEQGAVLLRIGQSSVIDWFV